MYVGGYCDNPIGALFCQMLGRRKGT